MNGFDMIQQFEVHGSHTSRMPPTKVETLKLLTEKKDAETLLGADFGTRKVDYLETLDH